jgi:hypothetical protein
MRTQDDTQRRLTPEDLEAIRKRFVDFEGRMPDVRAHGAVTITDVAEAFGVAPEEVVRILDRYREERALVKEPPRQMDQRGLFALAVILFGAAFGIYRYGPRTLSPEEREAQMEDRLHEIQARRKAHPVVHYPILTKVKDGALPPFGFNVTYRGRLTETSAASPSTVPMARGEAVKALGAALMHSYEVARVAEKEAPEPTKPLPKKTNSWGQPEVPNALGYSIGTHNSFTQGYVNLDPTVVPTQESTYPPQGAQPTPQFFERMAKEMVDGAAQAQDMSLKPQTPNVRYPTLPSGYTISMEGQNVFSTTSAPISVLPFDADRVEEKLQAAMRTLVLQQSRVWAGEASPYMVLSKKATQPAILKVKISGPLSVVEVNLPQTASAHYPTAADAMRASDRLLKDAVHRAADQVRTLNAQAGVKA